MISHQVIIVGGGLAGLRAALALRMRNVDVAVVSKDQPLDYAPKDGLRRGIKWTLVIVGILGVVYGLFVLSALVALR